MKRSNPLLSVDKAYRKSSTCTAVSSIKKQTVSGKVGSRLSLAKCKPDAVLRIRILPRPSKNGKTVQDASKTRSARITRGRVLKRTQPRVATAQRCIAYTDFTAPVKERENGARRKQDKEREDNPRARTKTYVTEGCHSATLYCAAVSPFFNI